MTAKERGRASVDIKIQTNKILFSVYVDSVISESNLLQDFFCLFEFFIKKLQTQISIIQTNVEKGVYRRLQIICRKVLSSSFY